MTETKKQALSSRTGYGTQSVANRVKKLFISGLSGLAATVLLLLIFSAIFAFSPIPDGVMEIFTYLAVAISAVVSGFIALRMIGAEGLVNGLIAGVMLFILHITLGAIFGDEGIIRYLIYGAVELPCGALGGVISVNLKGKKY